MSGAAGAVPAPISSSSATARSMPATGAPMSVPRSNLADASVFSPSFLLVRRTRLRLEAGALEHDRLGGRADFGQPAAHDAGDRLRAVSRRR